MTRDDIIRMAREQGLPETAAEGVFIVNTDDLGRMLAAEREACAAIAETPVTGEQDDITMEAKDRVADAIRARGD